MRDMGIVQGSLEQAKELIIGKDTVYVHSDIKEVELEDIKMWQYHEIQYEKNEYIKMMSEKDMVLEKRNEALEKEVTDTQTALTELFEMSEV